jgi:phage I-like protein
MTHLVAMNDTQNEGQTEIALKQNVGVCGTVIAEYSPAPEWIELLPAGDFAGRDGRGPFRLSNPAAVIAATDGLRMEAGLPIDYDHATDFAAPSGRPAPAAGWIHTIEVRDGALWGNIEWTSHGRAAVVTREYRYISPVFEYSEDGEVQRLLRAALTNNPNLYLTAISARAARGEPVFPKRSRRQHDAGAAHDRSLQRNETGSPSEDSAADEGDSDTLAVQLREVLGLDSESTSDEIVAEVRRVLAEASSTSADRQAAADGPGTHAAESAALADPSRYVPIEQFESTLAELHQMRAASARERAGFRVDAAMKAGKIVPAQREWAIAYCLANTSGFENFIARQPAMFAGVMAGFEGDPASARANIGKGDGQGLDNRRAGATLTRTELAVCARLGLRPHDYLMRRNAHNESMAIV